MKCAWCLSGHCAVHVGRGLKCPNLDAITVIEPGNAICIDCYTAIEEQKREAREAGLLG